MKLMLSCPRCGNTNWIVRKKEAEQDAFECAACEDLVLTQDMCMEAIYEPGESNEGVVI